MNATLHLPTLRPEDIVAIMEHHFGAKLRTFSMNTSNKQPVSSEPLSLLEQRRKEYEAMTPQEKEIRNKAVQKRLMEYQKMLPEDHLDIFMGSQDNEPF